MVSVDVLSERPTMLMPQQSKQLPRIPTSDLAEYAQRLDVDDDEWERIMQQ